MTRKRLQGHNEAEGWGTLTRAYPRSAIRLDWLHDPVDHWSITVTSLDLSHHPVTAYGYTRYEALNRVLVALEKEQRIQTEMMERSA